MPFPFTVLPPDDPDDEDPPPPAAVVCPNAETTMLGTVLPANIGAIPTQSTLSSPVAYVFPLVNPPLPLPKKMVRFPLPFSEVLATAKSSIPSPFRSPTATYDTYWSVPTAIVVLTLNVPSPV